MSRGGDAEIPIDLADDRRTPLGDSGGLLDHSVVEKSDHELVLGIAEGNRGPDLAGVPDRPLAGVGTEAQAPQTGHEAETPVRIHV